MKIPAIACSVAFCMAVILSDVTYAQNDGPSYEETVEWLHDIIHRQFRKRGVRDTTDLNRLEIVGTQVTLMASYHNFGGKEEERWRVDYVYQFDIRDIHEFIYKFPKLSPICKDYNCIKFTHIQGENFHTGSGMKETISYTSGVNVQLFSNEKTARRTLRAFQHLSTLAIENDKNLF